MHAPTLPDDFRDFLVALADAEVDFLLIGGFALAAYGYTRSTDDLDVLVRPSPENARRVFAALASFGAPVQQHGIRPDDFARAGYGYRMGIKPVCIEILTTIDGLDFDAASVGKRRLEIDGRSVPVIAKKPLIVNKRAAGRPKDLGDVEWLEANISDD